MDIVHLYILYLARYCASLIPISHTRRIIRKKVEDKIRFVRLGRKARIRVKKGNTLILQRPAAAEIRISGKNNYVIFKGGNNPQIPLPLKVTIQGDNNSVVIGENVHIENLIHLKIIASNTSFKIGKESKLNCGEFYIAENNSIISIGNDCLFSWDVNVWCTDGHAIIDSHTGARTNKGRFVEIGNHVWVGKGVQIGKNVKIASGCIIGWHSVVTQSVEEENCIIAGCPARVVKHNRTWDIAMPNDFDNALTL